MLVNQPPGLSVKLHAKQKSHAYFMEHILCKNSNKIYQQCFYLSFLGNNLLQTLTYTVTQSAVSSQNWDKMAIICLPVRALPC